MFNKRKTIIIILVVLLIIITGGFFYINQSYEPLEGNDIFLNKDYVTEYDKYYLINEDSEKNSALKFYQGGKVQETAYAPLCDLISQEGYTIFLIKMPFNLSVFDIDRASLVLDQYRNNYDNWFLAGHSLGGAMLADYISKQIENEENNFKGLIFLAAYPAESSNLSKKNIAVLSITASQDEVIDQNKLKKAKKYLPFDTQFNIIKGGNHAGFGNYGPQKGDGDADITKKEQWEQTVDLIVNFIKKFE